MIIQPIVNIAEICAQHKIEQAVICPGSRSAPITLAFARHPKIRTYVIPDERSAGFIALGLAQSSKKAVVVVCTSGTAVANLYPAIIEAYYQEVPLIILTADRPPEWIDQQDGQTIRQHNIFLHHVLASYQFPVSFEHEDARWHGNKMISEAILKATGITLGPVHVNIPIREPFYPSSEEKYVYSSHLKTIKVQRLPNQPVDHGEAEVIENLKKFKKIMVVAGQTRISAELRICLNNLQKKLNWVIIGDIIANIGCLDHAITKHEIVLENMAATGDLTPDLLITFGQGILSKNLKNFLRNEEITAHWHIGHGTNIIDVFKSLTRSIHLDPENFFHFIEKHLTYSNKPQIKYFNHWVEKNLQAGSFINEFFKPDNLSEFHAVEKVMRLLPDICTLHLANSMPIRYANYFGIERRQKISVWSNRGTSGIDGCMSTAVGHAINSHQLNVLLVGDMAFFYDRNSLWHNHIPENLRIIVLNNHGGGIFRLLNGSKQLEELEEFFETRQKLNAANTTRDFGMKYFSLKNIEALPAILDQLFDKNTGPAILEIETDPRTNQQVYEDFKHQAMKLWQ